MRLHRLVITGVGPFLGRQDIDFDALSDAGLFLIDGPTGSGKTTIIDAIVYALFGDVSGGNDSDTGRIRSSYCTESDPTGVLLEFSVEGRRHRITRVPAHARDPEQPDRSAPKTSRQVLTEFTADGAEKVVLTKVTDIRQHVEALLTMTSEQFRHLVVLPQGKFADLLRMTPTDRLTELASLLDQREFFARVQEDLKQQGMRAEDLRRAARDDVSNAAQQLHGRLSAHLTPDDPDFTSPSLGDAERGDAVETVLARITDRSTGVGAERDALAIVAEDKRRIATAARATATAIAEIGQAQQELADAAASVLPEDADVPSERAMARIGELRTREGSLGELAAWEADAPARAQQRLRLEEQEQEARGQAQVLQDERASVPAQRADLEARIEQSRVAAAALASATEERERIAALVDKAAQHGAAVLELDGLEQALARDMRTAEEAVAATRDAHDRWLSLIDQQRAHQAVALAAQLSDGSACPVCGSMEHPAPARSDDDSDIVTDAQITAARTTLDEAETRSTACAEAVSRAQQVREACATRVAVLAGALDGTSIEELPSRLSQAQGRAEAARLADAELPGLLSTAAELVDRESSLGEQITELLAAAAQLSGQRQAQVSAEEQERQRIAGAIGAAASATALLAVVRDRIGRLDALHRAQERLDRAAAAVPADQRTLARVDAEAAAEAAEAASRDARVAHAAAESEAATLAAVLLEAGPMATAFTEVMARSRAVESDTAAACQLAQLATGRNSRSLPLRSYALQRRFESVLAAATVHLSRMSSGKFSFELNEETTRGQAGLGIALHDAWTGHRQDPKSLSGGETFYAALSLALGLADVVRGEAGGSALDTLFIDEGFGSLDQDSLYQVLDQLDHLRAGRRVIGVISHVTEMRESIPDRVDVRRGPDSTSSVSTGPTP